MLYRFLVSLGLAALTANGATAQDGPFRLAEVTEDGVLAVRENSIRTNDQGFRTFRFAQVMTTPETVELDGREFESRAATGMATVDCSSGRIRLDRLDYLDHNYAVVGTEPASGFEDLAETPNLKATVCDFTPADIAALSVPFENVRSISVVAHNYTGAASRSVPHMGWVSVPREGDQATCLSTAHAALRTLGYRAEAPQPHWVGVYGSHPSMPIGVLIRCSSPGEFVVFATRPDYAVGSYSHELDRVERVLREN